jgi:hypothetical protein
MSKYVKLTLTEVKVVTAQAARLLAVYADVMHTDNEEQGREDIADISEALIAVVSGVATTDDLYTISERTENMLEEDEQTLAFYAICDMCDSQAEKQKEKEE